MIKDVNKFIQYIINHNKSIILLKGDLGSGKTYFVKEYMSKIYDFHYVASPTYTVCNTYNINNLLFFHFDFYIKFLSSEWQIALENFTMIFVEWYDLSSIKGYENISIIIDCDNDLIIEI